MIKYISKLHGVSVLLVLSIISLPLAYFRNWLLGELGQDFVVSYAIITLIINLVTTFLFFGSATSYAIFIPHYEKSTVKQYRFISTNLIFSFGLAVVGILVFYISEYLWSLRFKVGIDSVFDLLKFTLFSFFIILSNAVIYSLNGFKKFKLFGILSHVQIIVISTLLLFCYLFEVIPNNVLDIFYLFFSLISIIIIFVGGKDINLLHIFRIKKVLFDNMYLKQSVYLYLSSLFTYLYVYLDQLLILSKYSNRDLATYFMIIQICNLISFIPKKLLQFFQTTFSSISNNLSSAIIKYEFIFTIVLFFSFYVSIFLLCFKGLLFKIFNIVDSNNFFGLLIIFAFVSSLGVVNSSLIQAFKKNGFFLRFNVVIVFIQVLLCLLFMKYYDVVGIVIARVIVVVIGYITNLYFIKKRILIDVNLHIKEILFCLTAVVLFSLHNIDDIIYQFTFFSIFSVFCLFFIFKRKGMLLLKYNQIRN